MLFNKNDYILVNNEFKKASNILYEDNIVTDLSSFTCNNFSITCTQKVLKVNTEYSSFYFNINDTVKVKDLLLGDVFQNSVDSLYVLDKLVLNKHKNIVSDTSVKFTDKLFLNNYNYSTSFTDIIGKYNLPKHFLLKALTTGCPDEEFPMAKEWNIQLQKILDKYNLTISELSSKIVSEYSHKVSSQKVTINKNFIHLLSIFLKGDYEFLSHTSLKLYIHDSTSFLHILGLLVDLDINKSLYNDNYNGNPDCSIIIVNSNLIFNLFSTAFNNLKFLLTLKPFFKNLLLKILMKEDTFYLDYYPAKYLQQFFYNNGLLYSLEPFEDKFVLNLIKDVEQDDEHYYVNIVDIDHQVNTDNIIGFL